LEKILVGTLTKRLVDVSKPRDERYFVWCSTLPGFGVRVYPSGRKVFVAQVRIGRQQRRLTIGTYGPFTVEQARKHAEDHIRAAAEGRDPQREKTEAKGAISVAELCDDYLEAARNGGVVTRRKRAKSPATIAIDAGHVSRHIKPLIGRIPARDLRRADVQRMADDITAGRTAAVITTKPRGKAVVRGGAGVAARVVAVLGAILTWAQRRGYVPEAPNPAHGVEKAASGAKDRRLRDDELRALGKVLDGGGQAATALKFISLTGLRRGEAYALRWSEVDEPAQCLRLENTKTGRSVRPIGKTAIDLLRALPRRSDWVFPRPDGMGSADLAKRSASLFDAAGLNDARSHDLRRSFASVAADLGYSDATICELIGHARRGVTERHYVRRSDPALLAAADRVSACIAAMLDGREAEVVSLVRRFVET
jgi:integrase